MIKNVFIAVFCLLSVQITHAFDQQQAFSKLYKTLALTGNQMPVGEADIPYVEETQTDLVRQLINMNELTTDVVYCFWGDTGLSSLALAIPESDNPIVLNMYLRLEFNILKCNEFLDNTSNSDAESKVQRAEARFLRALFYSYTIDLWGDMPLWKTASDKPETRSSRQKVFDFIIQELKECSEDMRLPSDSEYGRADRVAAWLLLSRLYLNAEVYTGTAQWQQAKEYAQRVMDSSYSLCDNYAYLFMGDNNSNGAQSETILPVVVDGQTQYSYGNTMFLIAATHNHDMPSCGITQTWSGYYARYELLNKFFPNEDAPQTGTAETASQAKDQRCLLYGVNRQQGKQLSSSFYNGYSIDKFTNLYTYGNAGSDMYPETEFPYTDFPLLRMAEAYLCYAEADARQNGGSCTEDGLEKLNALRTRANAATVSQATLNDLADEWCREFYMEGRRRMDLIRFGLYTGDEYLWTGKGNLQEPTALETYRCLMPMPETVLIEHPQYTQNRGYYDPNFVPDELILNTPAFGNDIIDLKTIDAMRLSWQRPSNLPEENKAGIGLELSLSPDFLEPKKTIIPSEDACEALIDAHELNAWLQSYDGKAYELTSVTVYAHCFMRNGTSNNVELNVKAYDNTYEQMPQPWYFIGESIGQYHWMNSVEGLGLSMFPMNINTDGSSTFTGYFSSGDMFLIVNTPGSWDTVVRSNDGSPYSLSILDWGDNINISEDGWYTFNVYPQWNYATCNKADDQEWPLYTSMAMTSGLRGSVFTVMTSCNPNNPNNHIWYARMTFDKDDAVTFLLDGNASKQVGGLEFPFGYATDDTQSIPVVAGDYVVFFDDMTGYYQFTDATTGQLPQILSYNYRVLELTPQPLVSLVDVTTPMLKLCDLVLPSDAEVSNIRLTINDQVFEMNAQGEVENEPFIEIMTRLLGQLGRYSVEAQVTLNCMERDLYYTMVSEPFTLTLQMFFFPVEEHYYYIGGKTIWDFNNLTMPLTCLSGDQWQTDPRFQIDIPIAAGEEDYFNVFPESATTGSDPWNCVVRPEWNKTSPPCEGTIILGNDGGTWNIPAETIDKTYRLTLDFLAGTYSLVEIPTTPTALSPILCDEVSPRQEVFDLQGRSVNKDQLSKGVFIKGNRKLIIK